MLNRIPGQYDKAVHNMISFVNNLFILKSALPLNDKEIHASFMCSHCSPKIQWK